MVLERQHRLPVVVVPVGPSLEAEAQVPEAVVVVAVEVQGSAVSGERATAW